MNKKICLFSALACIVLMMCFGLGIIVGVVLFKNNSISNEYQIFDASIKNDIFECEMKSYDDRSFLSIININRNDDSEVVFIPTKINDVFVEEIDVVILDKKEAPIQKIYYNSPVTITNSPARYNCKVGYAMNLDFFKEAIGTPSMSYNNVTNPDVIYELNYNDLSFGYDYYSNTVINYIPPEPLRPGYRFMGWFVDKECTVLFDFQNTIINPNDNSLENQDKKYNPTLIYAGWESNYE